MFDVLHELVDAVAGLRGITGSRQADLHALIDQAAVAEIGAPAQAKAKAAENA